MLVRLDPDIPLVWRSPDTLQLGVDEVVATFTDTTGATARMLAKLGDGLPLEALRAHAEEAGGTPEVADAFLAAVRPALAGTHRRARPRRWRVAVDGAGAGAAAIARALALAGVDLVADAADPADAAVVVGAYAIEPARHGRWLRRDLPHLGVVFGDRTCRLGPFVEPGAGPCLRCVDLERTDADPAWPALAAQLVSMPAAAERMLAASVALRVATLVLDRLGTGDPSLATASLTIDAATGVISERAHLPHERCGCAAPPGTATAAPRVLRRS